MGTAPEVRPPSRPPSRHPVLTLIQRISMESPRILQGIFEEFPNSVEAGRSRTDPGLAPRSKKAAGQRMDNVLTRPAFGSFRGTFTRSTWNYKRVLWGLQSCNRREIPRPACSADRG